jgi:hypothetical protein
MVDISQEREKEDINFYDSYPMEFVSKVKMKNNPL